MEKKNKEKQKKSFRIGWKRSLIVSLVISLLVGGYSFADLGQKAEAAEYTRITGFDTFDAGDSFSLYTAPTAQLVKLEDGSMFNITPTSLGVNYIPSIPEGYKKFKFLKASGMNVLGNMYLTGTGDLYLQPNNGAATKMLSDVKDFENLSSTASLEANSFFALKNDGTVWAWGRGSGGQLGIGYKQDKNVPTEVVDPETGDPIEGVKKMYYLGRTTNNNSILLVKDNAVYLLGWGAFGLDSRSSAKPIKLDIFPSFSSADDFDLSFMGDVLSAQAAAYKSSSSLVYVNTARRVFTISGKQYTLTDFFAYDNLKTTFDELDGSTLYPLPDNMRAEDIQRFGNNYTTSTSYGNTISTGYVHLSGGVLTYWGTTFDKFGSQYPTFDATPMQIATGVDKVVTDSTGTIFYLRNKNVYAIGPNTGGRSGVLGGALTSPVKITGTNNEVFDIKDIAVSNGVTFALKEDNTLISWYDSNSFKTADMKMLGMYTVEKDNLGNKEGFVIGENNKVYHLDKYLTTELGGGKIPALAPKDYVAPVTAPDVPVVSIASQDKFNQNVVSINYGTTGDIATKQYQINGGGWTEYTGEIVVTQSGNVTIQARSADSNGNMSEVGELTITSDPIVITAGHPKIDKIAADEFKISADATGTVKVQVRVDGAAWQDFNTANNLLLTPGNHAIEVRLLNDRDQELINKTFDVTADNPAPVVVGKPVVTQKGLNNLYGLDIEVSYDASEGEALYSIDGGKWIATTGSFSVSNAAHTIRAKVVTADGKESEVTEFVTTVSQPKITVNEDQVSIELGINTGDVTVHYKDSNNQWVEYTGPVSFGPGTHNIEIEVRDNTGTPVFNGGPYTVTVIDPNAGNPGGGGTTPTPDPGTSTPIGEEDVDFTVNSGGLSSRFEGADLSTIIIDNTNPYQSINSVSRALIEDSRGNGKGYQYSLDVTDFVSDPMQDNSTNSQSLVVSIPANSLSVDVLKTKTITGPAAELSNVGKHVFSGSGPEMLATAKAFEGMGYNEIPLNFTLSIPDRVKIISSGSGSKFVPGESTGLMAGIYKSRFTFTLSSGI